MNAAANLQFNEKYFSNVDPNKITIPWAHHILKILRTRQIRLWNSENYIFGIERRELITFPHRIISPVRIAERRYKTSLAE